MRLRSTPGARPGAWVYVLAQLAGLAMVITAVAGLAGWLWALALAGCGILGVGVSIEHRRLRDESAGELGEELTR